jgi:hypothetical protein
MMVYCGIGHAPEPTSNALASRWTVEKAGSSSRSLLTFRTMSCCPMACAASYRSRRSARVPGLIGFTSTPIVVALGTSFRSSSRRFDPKLSDPKCLSTPHLQSQSELLCCKSGILV